MINNTAAIIFTESKMPIEVATPFPPLNFNVMGKTCPISKKNDNK